MTHNFGAICKGYVQSSPEDIKHESELVQTGMDSQKLEEINTDLIKLKDLLWHIEYDRIIVSQSVGELSEAEPEIGLLKYSLQYNKFSQD